MRKVYFILLACLLCLRCLQAQQSDYIINTVVTDIRFYEQDGYDFIDLRGKNGINGSVGEPELPIKKLKIALPENVYVEKVEIVSSEKVLLDGEYNIAPCRQPVTISSDVLTERSYHKKEIVYQNNNFYPETILYQSDEGMRDQLKIVTFDFFPLQYNPVTRKVQLIKRIDFKLTYRFGLKSVQKSIKMSEYAQAQHIKNLKRDILNSDDLRQNMSIVSSRIAANSFNQDAFSDAIVDYVIITADSLSAEFNELADWKSKIGIRAKVVSKEWLLLQFQGSDEQEKIRAFIQYAHYNWGTYWFLLGGDSDIIPARMGWSGYEHEDVKSLSGNNIPTDMYYACLDGDWNADGDMTYGEANYDKLQDGTYKKLSSSFADIDKTDREYDVLVGRIPVKNKSELENYKWKYFNYIKGKNFNPNKVLLFSGNSNSIESRQMDVVANVFYDNSDVYVQKYYECIGNKTSNCGTKADVLAAFNENNIDEQYHIFCGYGHGNIQSFGACDEGITLKEFRALQNTNASGQILYNNHCQTAAFDYDCIGESYIAGKNGGIVYIGNTRQGWVGDPSIYNTKFIENIYKGLSLEEAFYSAKGTGSVSDGDLRWGFFALNLFGDPEMQIWTDTPKSMAVKINPEATMPCGEGTVTVTINGLQNSNEKARICLYKKDEVFEPKTVYGNGTYTLDTIHPLTPGELYVTVTAHNYLPVEDTITVTANPNRHIRFKGMTIDDDKAEPSRGNGNGQIEAGETIELSLELENNGQSAAYEVKAGLTCASPYVDITTAQAGCGDIAAGQTKTSQSKYLIHIDADMPETLRDDPEGIVFSVDISDASGKSFAGTFGMDVFADDLHMRNRSFTGNGTPVAGQTLRFNIDLQNLGKTTAVEVTATLKDAAQNTICTRTYPAISRNETAQATAVYEYTVPAGYTGGALNMTLEVANEYGRTWTFPFDLAETRPQAVEGVNFTADLTAINMYWKARPDVAGYNIYRCDVDGNDRPVGNYTKLNTDLLSFAYFQDTGLKQLTKYHYRIAAVSTSGQEGIVAEKLAWTSLQEKGLFPVKMEFDAMRGGINVADVNGDGKQELFSTSRRGYLAGLDCEGNELYDIDNNVTTNSGFVNFGWQCDAMPAIGDLYGDGRMLIVQPTRVETGVKTNQLFCFSPEDVNPHNQRPDTVWHVPTNPLNAIALRPAVLANIDNSPDGSLEIIVPYENRKIGNITYSIVVYNADGTERLRLDWPGGYSAIAVADLNGDGTKEIIAATQTGVTAWDCQGDVVWNYVRTNRLFNASVTVCDLEGDGRKEILTIMLDRSSGKAEIIALSAQGEAITDWNTPRMPHTDATYVPSLSVGDLNHDGYLEIVTNGKGYIGIWDYQGNEINIINEPLVDQNIQNLILADVDGDPDVEIIVGSTIGPYVLAYKMDGRNVLGFPLLVERNVYSIPTVCDVDNDGKNEIVLSCEDVMHLWKTEGNPENIEWGMERHNPQNTGEYTKPCFSERIVESTIWTEDKSVCGDLTIYSGSSLKIKDCVVEFGSESTLVVHSGASLKIDGATLRNISVNAKPGSSIKVLRGGKVYLRKNGVFATGKGTLVEINNGEINHLR